MGLDFRPPARYLPVATALLSRGLPVSLTVEGDRVHPHVGKAIFIDNTVDSATSTFLMRAEVANPDGSLLPGQYIRAGMTIGEYVDAVVVPEQAVIEGQEGARVYALDARNAVEAVKVKPIDQYRGLRVLESGLEPGRKVIVEGIQLVRPGEDRRPGRGPAREVHPRYRGPVNIGSALPQPRYPGARAPARLEASRRTQGHRPETRTGAGAEGWSGAAQIRPSSPTNPGPETKGR